jgi:uncharacterized membrane protein
MSTRAADKRSSPEMNGSVRERRPTRLYAAVSLVALVGLADAIYLTAKHISGASVPCTIVAGCEEVLTSSYATIGGVPLALIGAAVYFAVFSLATLAAFGYKIAGTLLVPIVGLMFVTTVWLLYLQAFVIRHFCQFCLLSAGVTLLLSLLVVLILRTKS